MPRGEPLLLSNRYAIISETAPALRLSSAGWIDVTPSSLVDIGSTSSLFEYCKEKIVARIQPFSKRVRLFVDLYLDFVTARISTHAPAPESDDIFTAEDWIFSAWLPLPHARILLAPEFNEGGREFAELDVAFWTGDRLIGVQLEPSGSMIKSKRNKLACLVEHHPRIDIIPIPRDRLSETERRFPADLFDETFSTFWQGLTLPKGPDPSSVLNTRFLARTP